MVEGDLAALLDALRASTTSLSTPAAAAWAASCLDGAPRSAAMARALMDAWGGPLGAVPLPPVVSLCLVRYVRESGLVPAALLLARRFFALTPSYETATSLAATLEACGYLTASRDTFEQALTYAPRAVEALLDVGDLSLELGELSEADDAYARALALHPEHPWASVSRIYVRHLRGDAAAVLALQDAARREEPFGRAWTLCERIAPYRFVLPTPQSPWLTKLTDFTRMCLAEIVPNLAGSDDEVEIEIGLDVVDVPSAQQAFYEGVNEVERLLHVALVPKLHTLVAEPAALASPERTPLWRRLEDGTFVATREPPRGDLNALLEIAASDYDFEGWWARARAWASTLADDATERLLACMLHVPPQPEPQRFPPWFWRFRLQVTAAMTLVQMGTGWLGTDRERAALDVFSGPVDWTTAAMILALGRLRGEEPELAGALGELLRAQSTRIDGGPALEGCIQAPLRAFPELASAAPPQAPKSPPGYGALLRAGKAARVAGSYAEAAAYFEEVTKLQPEDRGAWRVLGEVVGQLGDIDRSLRITTHALTLDPLHPIMRTNFAIKLLDAGRREDALAELTRAVSDHPSNTWARHWRTVTLLALGQPDEASAEAARAAEVVDGLGAAATARQLYEVAAMLSAVDRHDQAVTFLAESIASEPARRARAADDEDFARSRTQPAFRALVEPAADPS